MTALAVALAILLPWSTGILLVWAAAARLGPVHPATLGGYGFLAGFALLAALLKAWHFMGLTLEFSTLSWVLALLIACAAGLGRHFPARQDRLTGGGPAQPLRAWEMLALACLSVLLVLHLGTALGEIIWRPTFPWDAWSAWTYRARVWFEQQSLAPIVDAKTWLEISETGTYTTEAHHYPAAVPLMQTWIALSMGRWEDTLINLPWLFCAAALGLAFYGQGRDWGIPRVMAASFVYLLLSLPLLDTHVALAGYADLWLATAYAMAGLALLQWARTRDWMQGLLALLMGCICALIKLEGLLWTLSLVPAALSVIAPRLTLGIALLAILGMVAIVGAGGVYLQIAGVGELAIGPKGVTLPQLGTFPLSYRSEWGPLLRNLFVLGNWNLLWYLWVGIGVLLVVRRPRVAGLLPACLLIGTSSTVLFAIFFLSPAAQWARDYTAINRLLLQVVPLYSFIAQIWLHALVTGPHAKSRRAPA